MRDNDLYDFNSWSMAMMEKGDTRVLYPKPMRVKKDHSKRQWKLEYRASGTTLYFNSVWRARLSAWLYMHEPKWLYMGWRNKSQQVILTKQWREEPID